MKETDAMITLKGIGEKTEKLFQKAGIYTVGDLLRFYPRGYEVYEAPVPISEIEEGNVFAVTGMISGAVKTGGSRAMQVTTLCIKDESASLKVIWFRMPFLKNSLRSGMTVTVRGRVVRKKDGLVMEHPEIFSPFSKYEEKLGTLQPVYPLTAGLTNNMVTRAMKQALDEIVLAREFLPKELRLHYRLAEYNYALRGIHFPIDKQNYYTARKRLVFEEFFMFILALRQLKESTDKMENAFLVEKREEIEHLIAKLPYELTNAQKKVWTEIKKELMGAYAMSRLVQGDVGSGKTIIALLALLLVGLNGYQGALMAPTEVLAKQHFESIVHTLEEHGLPLRAELLTGSMTAKEKRLAYERIAEGKVQMIIGTHALIQEKAVYHNLALVVTDEQHRFGVKQRETLAKKGQTPHMLVMSATPIPRTLAMIVYGDMDISVIDELPANRLPIKNCEVDTGYRTIAYQFMKKQVSEGRQCYIICPMVEESEAIEAENVIDYAAMLQEILGNACRIAYLHGNMKQKQKDEIMEMFAKKEIDILVSTTVIEVGINVPNATVMMVENAERFGLEQLHQLRGRVGRGIYQSYCIFMTASKAKETKKRLEILNQSNDGFFIASEDLKLRGPGDLFGIRQSGLLNFRLGDVFQDAVILQKANEAVQNLLEHDKNLEAKEHVLLKELLQKEKGVSAFL